MTIQTVLLIQPIFAPSTEQAQRNINSINSLGEYLKKNGTDGINLIVVMGGWAANDDLWNLIVTSGKQALGDTFNPIRFDRNYGKAMVVNNLYKHVISQNNNIQIQALFTMDSDIIIPINKPHLLVRLAVAADKMQEVKKQPWGLIGLNQLEHGCHFKSCYDNQAEYSVSIAGQVFNEKIVWPSIPSGIAGGCLFVNVDYWNKVGGYDVLGTYAGDDAYLLAKTQQLGYTWQMSDTIGIIHPFDNDKAYSEWKVKTCQRETSTGIKNDISSQIQEAENFWKNR